jgi:CRISPR-associated protein Csx17
MNTIDLHGCRPEPLMGYLKALGVFRLVAEQADPSATMSWHGGDCRLQTTLDRADLTDFILNRYRPTPIVGPWGARSGFYTGSSESSARAALNRIVAAAEVESRFVPFRDVVEAVRGMLLAHGFVEKVRDDEKLTLMRVCRNELPDEVVPWLDAVFTLTDDSRKFPPLLGTGGNEGSGSYVSSFGQTVVSLLLDRDCDRGLEDALFCEISPSLGDTSVGHFHPGAICGPNSSQGFDGGGGANPWDYLLAIEGTLMLAGAASRRMGVDTTGRAAFPFCVEAVAVGYASESDKEAANSTRAELWLPLWWRRPVSYAELRHLFSEGRAQFGRRQARNAVEFALAVNLLGVDRGVDAFVRYAFVMRNGLSYFAAPLGRVPVTPRPAARLLDDPALTRWLDLLRRACRDKEKTPARYQTALRRIDRALFGFAVRSETGVAADRRASVEVLRSLGEAERTLASGLGFCKDNNLRPLSGLDSRWLDQADDGSAEFRLAVSLAGIGGRGRVDPLRAFLEAVVIRKSHTDWLPGSTSAVWTRRPFAENLAAVFRRRLMEAFRDGQQGTPLNSPRRARLADVIAFLYSETDDDKVADLVWGLSAIDWTSVEPGHPDPQDSAVPFEFGVPRLLVEPRTIVADRDRWTISSEGEPNVQPDPDVFHTLASGQPDAVGLCVDRAAGRLKTGGRLVIGYRNRRLAGRPFTVVSPIPADRLLAAMLFPLSNRDLETVANAVLYPPEMEES